MTKAAFIVEGQTERNFLSAICPGHPIRRLEMNGRDVAIEAIVKKIDTLSALFSGQNSPIIVVFDREGRSASAASIADQVKGELSKRRPQDQYVIGVADRMLENWILADWEQLQTEIGSGVARPFEVEGIYGKSFLRSLLRAKGYSAAIDGPQLLKKARPSEIQKQSPSFNLLREQLDLDCWWLKR